MSEINENPTTGGASEIVLLATFRGNHIKANNQSQGLPHPSKNSMLAWEKLEHRYYSMSTNRTHENLAACKAAFLTFREVFNG
jgi:hypothetical protein